jgi:hypothetical protein
LRIEEALANPQTERESAPARGSSRVWIAIACAAVIAGLVGWLRPGSPAIERPAMILSIVPPAGMPLKPVGSVVSAPEISPDGSAILYMTDTGMFVRRLDSLESHLVPGQIFQPPFWSPDSARVGYATVPPQLRLVKVRLPDGAPEAVTSNSAGVTVGGSWSDAGAILVASGACLNFAPASGGEIKPVEMPGPLKEGQCYFPEFLPVGQDFLFLFVPSRDSSDAAVYLATLRDGKAADPVMLLKNQTAARYTPAGGGRILFVRNDNLYSQKLNRQTRKLEGEAELAVQGVSSQPSMDTHQGDFSVARNGTIAWRPGKAGMSLAVEFDRNGNQIGTSGPPGSDGDLALSPDERHLVISSDEAAWLAEVGQPGRSDLPGDLRWFGWFAGGSKLLGFRAGALVEMPASGSGQVHELGKFDLSPLGMTISSDGKQAFVRTINGIVSLQLDGTPEEMKPRVVVERDAPVRIASFSPDGRWLVYDPLDTGIYVRPSSGPELRRQIATRGATG